MGRGQIGFLWISLILVLIYIILLTLKNKKIIKEFVYKRILNIFLLISFLLVFYSALVSIFWMDFKIELPDFVNHRFWGIIMIWLSIFHFIERFWFFKPIFKFRKKETPEIK